MWASFWILIQQTVKKKYHLWDSSESFEHWLDVDDIRGIIATFLV